MKLKLDENLGASVAKLFIEAGFDTTTISEEDLNGTPDEQLIEILRTEGKCLVSLDMGFSNPLKYPPGRYHGIIVMRAGTRASLEQIIDVAETVIEGLTTMSVDGKLWVARPGRIREHRERD